MYIVVLITAKNVKEAQTIGQGLVNSRLAACVNIVKNVQSIFSWQGKIDQAQEALLIVKSTKSQFSKIVKKVHALHSYTVPEIIALPIVAGSKNYLQWIDEAVKDH
jgi:periplasmic divalent cation tolerance protein